MSTQQTETKLVKIKLLRDVLIPIKQADGTVKEDVVKASTDPMRPTVVEVSEDVAKEYCDKKFDAPSSHRGMREENDPANKNFVVRAVRL